MVFGRIYTSKAVKGLSIFKKTKDKNYTLSHVTKKNRSKIWENRKTNLKVIGEIDFESPLPSTFTVTVLMPATDGAGKK